MAIVIEFVGVPGVGKTTLANALKEKLVGQGLSAHTKPRGRHIFYWTTYGEGSESYRKRSAAPHARLTSGIYRELIRMAGIYFWMAAFALSVRPFQLRALKHGKLVVGWYRRVGRAFRSNGSVHDVCILDEGVYHLLTRTAMFGERYSTYCLQQIAKRFSQAPERLLVFITACYPEQALYRRLKRHGNQNDITIRLPRNDQCTYEEAIAIHKDHDACVRHILSAIEAMPNGRCIALPMNNPLNESTQEIASTLPNNGKSS